jgi:hypothetical protein
VTFLAKVSWFMTGTLPRLALKITVDFSALAIACLSLFSLLGGGGVSFGGGTPEAERSGGQFPPETAPAKERVGDLPAPPLPN